jgi:hypothetical protein
MPAMSNRVQIVRIGWGAIFAIAMAYLEAAVVVYLRKVYGITDLISSVPAFDSQIGMIELGRELATLIMLFAVGWAVGSNFRSRAGYAIFAFGLWDIFYYIWLRVMIGWPRSLLEPDLLFLIPLPWWGPVLSPVLIALLMVISGAVLDSAEDLGISVEISRFNGGILGFSVLIMLYTFMRDALALLPSDVQTLSQVKLTNFNWPVFLCGYGLGVFGLWRSIQRTGKKNIRHERMT